jgi:hypothetical protein
MSGPCPPHAVRAENPVHGSDQQSCPANRLAVMITDHVPAVRLPPDHAASRVAAAVPARGGMEDRRDLGLAPPARRAATAAAPPPEPELGGPGTAHDPAKRDTQSAPPGATAAGYPRTRSCAGTATSSAPWASPAIGPSSPGAGSYPSTPPPSACSTGCCTTPMSYSPTAIPTACAKPGPKEEPL